MNLNEVIAKQHVGAVGDHLVEVHVALGARAGLPHHQGKVVVELALDHLARGADDRVRPARVDEAELAIGLGCGQLDDAERMHERNRHAVFPNTEILPGALGLRAPIAVGGDLDRTKAVGLDPGGRAA